MDDIFTQCREGNAVAVRLWLDNTENDLNQGYVHFQKHLKSFEMLLAISENLLNHGSGHKLLFSI